MPYDVERAIYIAPEIGMVFPVMTEESYSLLQHLCDPMSMGLGQPTSICSMHLRLAWAVAYSVNGPLPIHHECIALTVPGAIT